MGGGLQTRDQALISVLDTNIAHKDSTYWADSTQEHIEAGKLSYCVARETRTLLKSSLHYHLFLRDANNRTKPHTDLGHIINPNTGVEFQWGKGNFRGGGKEEYPYPPKIKSLEQKPQSKS